MREQLAKASESAETSSASFISLREQVVTYEKERSKLRGELEIAQAALLDQEKQLKANERTMARLEASGININESQGGAGPDTPIHAKVLAVRPDVNVVLLVRWQRRPRSRRLSIHRLTMAEPTRAK